MARFFKDPLHDQFGTWPVAYIPYGGADLGEIEAVARAVGDGGDDAFHGAWVAAAERFAAGAQEALDAGRRATARELFLRGSCFFAASYHPLYGEPVDQRLLAAFRRQVDCLDRGLALGDPPVAPVRIPFEGTTLPAYLLPAEGRAGEVRPLLILTNGYDGTITDMYFATAVAATRRGYHCLLFDGPGQGELLYERGLRLRPDWETVVRAVVDFAVAQPKVDTGRIALAGWSLGGYLAPRAASGEPRLAACIADPGLWGIASAFRHLAMQLGATAEEVADPGALGEPVLERIQRAIDADRRLRWTVVQRGYWVHGTATLADFLRSTARFTMEGRAGRIRCPTLLTAAENDPLGAGADAFYEALECPKQLMRFSAAEGADGHCEMRNRSLVNRRILDWLDGVLGQRA